MMSASHSQQGSIDRLNETIQNLQFQLANISQRLEKIEGNVSTPSVRQDAAIVGSARFLGRRFRNKNFQLNAAGTTHHGRFLGRDYDVLDAKVEMQDDGTKRTFLGREFMGQTLR